MNPILGSSPSMNPILQQTQNPENQLSGGVPWGNVLSGIGMSLMSSPRNAPLANAGQYIQQAQTQSMKQQEAAQKKAALKSALTQFGLAPEQAEAMAQDETAANLYLRKLEMDRQQKNADRAFAQGSTTEISRNLVGAGFKPGTPEYVDAYKKAMGFSKPTATYGVIGQDEYGNSRYGWIDPTTQTTTPAGGQGGGFAPQTAATEGQPGIPPAPPGVNPKVWRDEQTKRLATEGTKPLPAEIAGRVGMAETYLQKAPNIRKQIADGFITGPYDNLQARKGLGERGQVYADIESGVDALRRGLTGAGMSESESADYARRYLPTAKDTADTLLRKHDRLVEELNGIRSKMYEGHKKVEPIGVHQPGQPPAGNQSKQSAPRQIQKGQTATNPKTGETVIFDGQQWVPFT